MPLPVNITTVTVSHKHTSISGAAMSGSVAWTLPIDLVDASAVTSINASSLNANLDLTGAWSVTLPVVDDPDAQPTGWTYTVTFNLFEPSGLRREVIYHVQLTAAMFPAVDWSTLTQLSPVGEVSPYARLAVANIFTADQTFLGALRLGDPATLPATDPTGGGTLYADGGALKWRNATGTIAIAGRDAVNVADFGAVGNGIADDKAAIQAAINAASTGSTILLNGTHRIAGWIDLKSNVTLDGSSGSLVQATALSQSIRLNNLSNVTVRNVQITGVGTDYENTSNVYSASGVHLVGVNSKIRVIGCQGTNLAGGGVVVVGPSTDLEICDCQFTGPGAAEIVANDQFGGGVVFNTTNVTRAKITGCTLTGYAQGIVLGDTTDLLIANNIIHDIVGQHGIYLTTVNNGVITGNVIKNANLQGVKIQVATAGVDASQISITGNTITDVGSHPVLLTVVEPALSAGTKARRIVVTGNTLRCNTSQGGDGVVATGLDGLIVANNNVSRVGRGLRVQGSSNVSLSGNRIHTTKLEGIWVDATSDLQILGNRITNPASANGPTTEFGINLTGATSSVLVSDNIVTDTLANMRYGLYVDTGVSQGTVAVRDNEITGATDYAVRLDPAQSIKEWRGNSLQGTIGAALNFAASRSGTVNVGDFGAVGNGIADDTTAIQAAINAASPNATVLFPPTTGNYRISGPLSVVTPGLTIQGSGPGVTIEQVTWLKPVFDIFLADNVTVESLRLIYTGANRTDPGTPTFRSAAPYNYSSAVWTNANRTTVRSCFIDRFGIGVNFESWTDNPGGINGRVADRTGNQAYDLEMAQVDFGILTIGQVGLRIDNLYVRDNLDASSGANPTHAIYMAGGLVPDFALPGSNGFTISNVRNVNNPFGHAIVMKRSLDGTVTGVTATNTAGACKIQECDSVVVTNVIAKGQFGAAGGWAMQFAEITLRSMMSNIVVQMAASSASPGAVLVHGNDLTARGIKVLASHGAGNTTTAAVDVRGNGNFIDNVEIIETGTPGLGMRIGFGLPTLATSNVIVRDATHRGTTNSIATVDSAATNVSTGAVAGGFLSTHGDSPGAAAAVTGGVATVTASGALMIRFTPPRDFTLTSLMWISSTPSGNYDIAVLDSAGNRLWSKGSTAWTAVNNTGVIETVGLNLTGGVLYWIVFAADNTTGQVRGTTGHPNNIIGVTGSSLVRSIPATFPIPATVSTTTGTSPEGRLPLIILREV